MRIDWRHDDNAPYCRVMNLDTGEQILRCAMADEETGEYEQWAHDGDKWLLDATFSIYTIKGKCRLEIVPLLPNEDYVANSTVSC